MQTFLTADDTVMESLDAHGRHALGEHADISLDES